MADTIADLPKLRLRLAEAELAEHELAIGQSTQTLTKIGDGSITYSQTNRSDLMAYITDLKGRIAALEGGSNRRAPILLAF